MNILRTKIDIVLLAIFAILGQAAFAVPAKPGVIVVEQADGSKLPVRLMGDERSHYYLTEDNYLLVNDGDIYYYGNADATGAIVRSDIRATAADIRTAEARQYLQTVDMDRVFRSLEARDNCRPNMAPRRNPGLFETGFPSTGDQKGIVVLVEYTDVKFSVADPYDYFNRMLNEDGFNDYGGTGCAAEYFRLNSKNRFRPQFDVYGPITLAHNMSYYGGNDSWWGGNDLNPQKMAIEACQQLDATVDFSEYDRDHDGMIDNVFVFYAGRGEASGGSSDTVWPHSWNVTAAEYTEYYFDGVQLDRYACSNEWEGTRPDGVGTFIHEFSHVMGLPDLYATSYTSAFTPGSWSALDYGPYNNNGCTPPLYSIFERYALEWIEPTVLDGPATVTLRNISDNTGCIIKTPKSNEYFLLENRQQKGWDEFIPGHGMLVWHVDFDQSVWNSNTVNNSSSHQYVDIEEADNSQNEYTRDGDSFPGANNVTSFTDDTRPSMKTWSGARLNLPITNITENDGIIRFDIAGGRPAIAPTTALEATDITAGSFVAHWEASPDAISYDISVYTKQVSSSGRETQSFVSGYNLRNVGDATSVLVEGLTPLTQYYYVVYAVDSYGRSDASNEIAVTTGDPTFDFFTPVATDATDIKADGFIAHWEPLDGADAYILDVCTKILGDFEGDLVDFADGVKNLPSGWSSNSTLSYANTAYSGEAVPSLRLSRDCYIESPVYSGDVHSLSFWHRGNKSGEDNTIVVSAATATGSWTSIGTFSVTNDAGGRTITIDNIPAGTRKVRIEYVLVSSGSVAIDDIFVSWGGTMTIDNATTFEVGNVTSFLVEDLDAETEYYYAVTAISHDDDAELRSLRSNEVRVTTAAAEIEDPSGISDKRPADVVVKVVDGVLTIAGADGRQVTVTDIAGRTLHSLTAGSSVSIALPARGIYIVKVGNSAVAKVMR